MSPDKIMSETGKLVNAGIVFVPQFYILCDFEVLFRDLDLSFDPPFKGLI